MPKLSFLDLTPIAPRGTAADTFATSVRLAQSAEKLGYHRVWYMERHNARAVASSTPAVLIAHVASRTNTIRVGAGAVTQSNHSPLAVAETFGTLATLYPDRIDLGFGQDVGTDPTELRHGVAESFPSGVREVQRYLSGESVVPGVVAVPQAISDIPIHVFGTSSDTAQLAADYGLPYAFGSHVAPASMIEATDTYRSQFVATEQLEAPYVTIAVNVAGARSDGAAREKLAQVLRTRLLQTHDDPPPGLSEWVLDSLLDSQRGRSVQEELRLAAVGDALAVREYLTSLLQWTAADELLVAPLGVTADQRLESLQVAANALQLPAK